MYSSVQFGLDLLNSAKGNMSVFSHVFRARRHMLPYSPEYIHQSDFSAQTGVHTNLGFTATR